MSVWPTIQIIDQWESESHTKIRTLIGRTKTPCKKYNIIHRPSVLWTLNSQQHICDNYSTMQIIYNIANMSNIARSMKICMETSIFTTTNPYRLLSRDSHCETDAKTRRGRPKQNHCKIHQKLMKPWLKSKTTYFHCELMKWWDYLKMTDGDDRWWKWYWFRVCEHFHQSKCQSKSRQNRPLGCFS